MHLEKRDPGKGKESIMSKLFIIDDDKLVTSNFADFFVGKGYIVATSNTPFGVTNGIKLFLPDVVIADMNISGLSGKGLLNIIGDSRSFKVVLLAEDTQKDEMKDLTEKGLADDFFVKGEPLLQLALKIGRLLGGVNTNNFQKLHSGSKNLNSALNVDNAG